MLICKTLFYNVYKPYLGFSNIYNLYFQIQNKKLSKKLNENDKYANNDQNSISLSEGDIISIIYSGSGK